MVEHERVAAVFAGTWWRGGPPKHSRVRSLVPSLRASGSRGTIETSVLQPLDRIALALRTRVATVRRGTIEYDRWHD